jgi:hypothetical protein
MTQQWLLQSQVEAVTAKTVLPVNTCFRSVWAYYQKYRFHRHDHRQLIVAGRLALRIIVGALLQVTESGGPNLMARKDISGRITRLIN